MSPSVRPAGSADLDQILAIESSRPTAPGWSRGHFEREISSERSYFVVLEQDGRVLGYAGFWKIPPEAQITTLVVSPEASGRGLGRRLFGHLLEAARSLGLQKVTLEVSSSNEPALRLYRRAGFRAVGRRARFYHDGSDAILMDLSLPPSP